ncbi:lysoplasmalogenase [Rhodococcus rhodochrous]|uniref:lysoplasmalogenase n=1 Tax=Rhodococcus rhodochrous TaxID=1829 RepID=UPI000D052E69|nr:lysoplasmalogenase [Rhodococcus rhodochrous]AYA26351.1 lysoplasmalogenase [Rhodococcus rhodochrous]
MSRRTIAATVLGAFAIVAAAHLVFQVLAPDSAFTDVSQWFLMPLLALGLVLVTSAPRDRLVVGTLVALGFSWLGDTAPDLVEGDASFLVLVGFFLCAQLTYIVAFRPYRRSSVVRTRPWVVGLYALAVIAMVAVCASAAGILVVPMAVYASCLAAMAVLATGLNRTAAVGAMLFVVSDALIAARAFVDADLPAVGLWIMATYIAAQALIVRGVLTAHDRRGPAYRSSSSLATVTDVGASSDG